MVPATSLVIRRSSPMQAIDERGLADVGPADDRDADAAVFVLLLVGRRVGKPGEHDVHELFAAATVRGGDGDAARRGRWLWKSAPAMPASRPSALLTARNTGLPERRSSLREELILRREPGARVGDEDQPVGFLDRVLGLDAHQRVHAARILDEAAGVDADVLHGPSRP